MSKERVSVLVCANYLGTEKLTPLVIGKAAKPFCFRETLPKLPKSQKYYSVKQVGCLYRSQKKAWMSRDLFTEWLKDWQLKLQASNRKVLLILDNFSGHKVNNVKLPNIEILFLPANTTSVSQAMDQGIIQNVKIFFKRDLINFYWGQVEALTKPSELKPINLLQAIRLLKRAWETVKPATILNCFRKSLPEFQWPQVSESVDDLDDFPPVHPSILRQLFPSNVTFSDYVEADNNVLIGEYSPNEISQSLDSDTEVDEDVRPDSPESDSESDPFESVPKVSNKQAIEAVTILLRHCNQANSFGTTAYSNSFTNYLNEAITARFNEAKQSSILDFFKQAN